MNADSSATASELITRVRRSLADGTFPAVTLKASSRFWFAVTVVSQSLFATYIVLLFGLSAVHGHLGDRARFNNHAFVPGDHLGNLAVAGHMMFAIIINLSGALQLVPSLRNRAPLFHRWNGRIFIVGAFVVSLAGLYMIWIRGAVGDLPQHVASTIDALLILSFATLALRTAMGRKVAAHRQWALRLFMVISGVWFFRLGVFLWIAINHGPAGFDDDTFTGPFLTIWGLGSFLLPLAILEVYLRGEKLGIGNARKLSMACLIVVATLMIVAGTFQVTTVAWVPAIRNAATISGSH